MPNNAIQVWSPDTCGCEIHLAFDDTLPPEKRTLTYVTWEEAEAIHQKRLTDGVPNTIINYVTDDGTATGKLVRAQRQQQSAKVCPAHASTGAKPQLLVVVQEENNRKNDAHFLALVERATKRMADTIRGANEGLSTAVSIMDKLHLKVKDFEGLNPKEQYVKFYEAISLVRNEEERNALSQEVIPDLEYFKWSFDSKRKLIIEVSVMTQGETARLQTTLNTKFGINKVTVCGG